VLFNVFGETSRILSSLSEWTALGWPFKASLYRLIIRWILTWHALWRWCQTRQFFSFFTHHILQSVESSTPLWNTIVPTNISSMRFLLQFFYMSLVLLIEWTLTQSVYWTATTTSPKEWWYHMLHVYNNVTFWRWVLLLETYRGILYK